jgi:hypothetical protein
LAALNRLLEPARAASEMQPSFLAKPAHKLRTPRSGLQVHPELLMRRDLARDVIAPPRLRVRDGSTLAALSKKETVPDEMLTSARV